MAIKKLDKNKIHDSNISEMKLRFEKIYKLSLLFWIFVVAFGFTYILYPASETPHIINMGIDDLNNLGGFLNLSTSLTGIITVYLLAKAVIYQKDELYKVTTEMKTQKDSLEAEEKTNRAIKYMDEWNEIHHDTNKEMNSQKMGYLFRMKYLSNHKIMKHKIDFYLLINYIEYNGLRKLINSEIIKTKNKIKQVTSDSYYFSELRNEEYIERKQDEANENAIENGQEIIYTEEKSAKETTNENISYEIKSLKLKLKSLKLINK